MNAKTNAQGKDRKNLVKAIAGITGQAAKYNGAPAFTYTVGTTWWNGTAASQRKTKPG